LYNEPVNYLTSVASNVLCMRAKSREENVCGATL